MSRNTVNLLNAVIVAVSLASASLAGAQQQGNPLHPAYFANKSVGNHFASSGEVSRYIDSHNPLHPAFARAGEASSWDATRAASTQSYIDTHNPLHPKFQRN